MPLVIEMQDAAPTLKEDYNIPLIEGAEFTFEFPASLGDFTTTGVVTTDEPASVIDGDPVVLTYTNMTIQSGHIFRPSNRCKGLFLQILGDLVVNGRLTMSARGAAGAGKYVGIDPRAPAVYFHPSDIFTEKNLPVILPTGGNGGARRAAGANGTSNVYNYAGYAGSPGINGACGGGGGGSASGQWGIANAGAGSAGTSFSGGAGGGGAATYTYATTGGNGGVSGGAGGAGQAKSDTNNASGAYGDSRRAAGGGAGNAGGAGQRTSTALTANTGGNGTGGLLILVVKGNIILGPSGSIDANGVAGGAGTWAGGGGSGGGAVHLFHKGTINDIAKILATGGNGGSGKAAAGKGGNGTVNIVQL